MCGCFRYVFQVLVSRMFFFFRFIPRLGLSDRCFFRSLRACIAFARASRSAPSAPSRITASARFAIAFSASSMRSCIFGWVQLQDGSFVALSPRLEIYFFIVGVMTSPPEGAREEGSNCNGITQLVNIGKIQPQAGRSFPRSTPVRKKDRVSGLGGCRLSELRSAP